MGEAGFAVALLSLAFVTGTLAVARCERRAFVRVEKAPLDEPLLVVIPARDEEARIGLHLAWLLRDPAPQLRVLVVDDRSSDRTAERVREVAAGDVRVHLLRLDDDPPAGVFGKPRALHAAMEHAKERGLLTALTLFVDADVRLEPGALGGLVRALRGERACALSGAPRLLVVTAIEQLLVPAFVAVVLARFLPSRVHRDDDDTAFLNGQIILVDTAALSQVGGWASVQDTVLEDVALARKLKRGGHRLRLADLRQLASTRMYSSFGGIVDGFGKNAVALLGKSAAVVGVTSFLMSLLPFVALALAAAQFFAQAVDDANDPFLPFAPLTLACVAAVMFLQTCARKYSGAPRWPVVVLPLAYLGVAFVLLRASLHAMRRTPIVWKGRRYDR